MESWELVEHPENRVICDASDSEYDIGSDFSSDELVFDEDIDEPVCSEPNSENCGNIENENLRVLEYKKIPFLENLNENRVPILIEKERVDAMSLCLLALLNQIELEENREVSSTRGSVEEILKNSEASNVFEKNCDQNDVEVTCQCISPRIVTHALENTSAAVSEKIHSFLDEDGVLDKADEICRAFIDKVCTYEFESTANTLFNKVDEFLDTADNPFDLTTFLA
jgi:hypothetical protein